MVSRKKNKKLEIPTAAARRHHKKSILFFTQEKKTAKKKTHCKHNKIEKCVYIYKTKYLLDAHKQYTYYINIYSVKEEPSLLAK